MILVEPDYVSIRYPSEEDLDMYKKYELGSTVTQADLMNKLAKAFGQEDINNYVKIFFSIIILFSATNLYADPMKVENDWDIIESTYVDKLSNVDNTFTLEVIDNVLQGKSINSDEYCPIISFDYLDEILKQLEDDTTYRVFLFDDNSSFIQI